MQNSCNMKLFCSMLWGGLLRTWFWIFLLSIFLHNTDCTISQENHSDECKVTSVDEELKRGEEVIYRIIHWKVSSFITYMWTDSIIKDMFSFSIQFQKTLCLHNVPGTEDTERQDSMVTLHPDCQSWLPTYQLYGLDGETQCLSLHFIYNPFCNS